MDSFNSPFFRDEFSFSTLGDSWDAICLDEAMSGLEEAMTSIAAFDNDVDSRLLLDLNALPYPDTIPEPDWTSLNISDYFPHVPAPASDTSSDATSSPISPHSESTLVASPSGSSLQDFKCFHTDFLPSQDTVEDDVEFDFTFAFECLPPVMSPSFPTLPLDPFQLGLFDNGYGQPVSQHAVGAAGAEVHGLLHDVGVAVNADDFAFPSTTPPSSPPTQDTPSPPVKGGKRGRDEDTRARLPKRRRRQDTTPRFPCPHVGCTSVFARSHNLKVHVSSVHNEERKFVCHLPGCPRKFSRRHDLTRHIQSKHTDLGSPRRKNKVADATDNQ